MAEGNVLRAFRESFGPLLYLGAAANASRLHELVKLDVPDINALEETLRVTDKMRTDRICPVGGPALRAIQN